MSHGFDFANAKSRIEEKMKKDWEIKKLGDVCETRAGGTPLKGHKEYYENGDIPWLRSGEVCKKDITESELFITEIGLKNSSAKLFPINTVLVAMYGATAGQTGILKFESSTNQAVCGILPNENFIPEFLYYFFLSYKKQLVAQAVGGAQPNISQIKICNILVPVPPLEEQKRIVKILDEKFARLETIKANAKENLQNAKDLFQSQLTKAFSNSTWEKKRLGEVCKIRPSKNETTKFLKDDDMVSFLPMEDLKIMNYYIEPKQSKKLKDVSGSYTCFANGDVLLAKVTPCFENGKQGIAKDLENGVGFGSSEYIVFRPSTELSSEYLYYSLATSHFRENGKKHLLGACGLKRLSKEYVNDFEIPLPPLPEQKRIVEELDTLSQKVRQLQEIYTKQIANCEELKQFLLQKAFEGEL